MSSPSSSLPRIACRAAFRAARRLLALPAPLPSSLSLPHLRTALRAASAASGPEGIAAVALDYARAANTRADRLGAGHSTKPLSVAFAVGTVLRRRSGARMVVCGWNFSGLQPSYLCLPDVRDAYAASPPGAREELRAMALLHPALELVNQGDLLPLSPTCAPVERIVLHPWLGRYFQDVVPELGRFIPNRELAVLYPDDALATEALCEACPRDKALAAEAASLLSEVSRLEMSLSGRATRRSTGGDDEDDDATALPSPRGRTRSA